MPDAEGCSAHPTRLATATATKNTLNTWRFMFSIGRGFILVLTLDAIPNRMVDVRSGSDARTFSGSSCSGLAMTGR